MWATIVISILTIAALASIFIGAFVALVKNPPTIRVTIQIPDRIELVQQRKPADIETDKPTEVPIPENILDYISLESDQWAQDARKRRARSLYHDSGDWTYTLRQLQIEDGSK